jgi:hypothetical protein
MADGRRPIRDARSAQFQEIAPGFDGLIEFDPHEVEIVHIATQPSQHFT